MRLVRRLGASAAVLVGLVGLVGCGTAADLAFGTGGTTLDDAGDDAPYPDGGGLTTDAGSKETSIDAPAAPKCPEAKDGKGNVCVRVLRGAEGPSINADSKALGLDGHGAILVGLSSTRSLRDLAFVAQTWYPTESSGMGKVAASELPKVAEPLPVAPGTYYAFATFRDAEPYLRGNVAVGDYVPRLVELPSVTVTANSGINVDVLVYPLRGIDVDVQLTTTPQGSGAGPLAGFLLDGGKILGEGGVPCADLSGGKTATMRLFTTYVGSFDIAAALFDFGTPPDDASGLVPTMPMGTLEGGLPAGAKMLEGDWLAHPEHVDLSKVEPISGPRPYDTSPTCATAAYAPPK